MVVVEGKLNSCMLTLSLRHGSTMVRVRADPGVTAPGRSESILYQAVRNGTTLLLRPWISAATCSAHCASADAISRSYRWRL